MPGDSVERVNGVKSKVRPIVNHKTRSPFALWLLLRFDDGSEGWFHIEDAVYIQTRYELVGSARRVVTSAALKR